MDKPICCEKLGEPNTMLVQLTLPDGKKVTWQAPVKLIDKIRRVSTSVSPPEPLPPICEECDVEMERGGPSLDTGREYWHCPECGWSWDIEDGK